MITSQTTSQFDGLVQCRTQRESLGDSNFASNLAVSCSATGKRFRSAGGRAT